MYKGQVCFTQKWQQQYVTVHNKFSKIPPSTSIHFATRVRNSRVILRSFIFTFLCAGSSIQNASQQIVSCIYLSFINFAFRPNPHKKSNEKWAPDSNTSNSVTEKYHEILHSRQSFSAIFSKWTHRDFTFGALALVQLPCSMTVHPAGSHELVDLCQQTKQVPEVSLCVIINNTTME
jgi:hypothetical protein